MNKVLTVALVVACAVIISQFAPRSDAQPTTPGVVVGCVYNATPPTLSDRQTGVLQCDSAGRLKVVTTP